MRKVLRRRQTEGRGKGAVRHLCDDTGVGASNLIAGQSARSSDSNTSELCHRCVDCADVFPAAPGRDPPE
jgi:hypothetical protein